jgi:hypothetical protein
MSELRRTKFAKNRPTRRIRTAYGLLIRADDRCMALTRRRSLGVVALVMAAAYTALSAQTTSTADGVAAFDRGDYQRAAEVLGPIAERFPLHDDPAAQFVMAELYASGRGVPRDRVRACALYTRASKDATSAHATRAMDLAHEAWASLDREDRERCELLVNLGLRHGFEPATFDLGPEHWVSVGLQSVTVNYRGQERRSDPQFAATTTGVVFLPIEHTALPAIQPELLRRHFIHFAAWTPENSGAKWNLVWQLFEVIRSEWVPLTITTLATFSGAEPPRTVDLQEMARVRVGPAGDAELVVASGPDAGTHHLESESEKRDRLERDQERAERERERSERERQVDWNAVREIDRSPTLSYVDGGGCAYVFLYAWSTDLMEVISLRADRDLLQLSTTRQTFDLGGQRPGLDLRVQVYERPQRSWPFCTDIAWPPPPTATWRAVAGSVTIEVTNLSRVAGPGSLRATAHISGAEFVRDGGGRVRQIAPIVLTAIVGWMSG